MLHVVIQLAVLAAAGPIAGLALAHLTGRLTWRRTLLAAALCQLLVMGGYVATHGVVLRVYGDEQPTAVDYWMARAQLVAFFTVVGVIVAALLTPLARWVTRRYSTARSRPPLSAHLSSLHKKVISDDDQ